MSRIGIWTAVTVLALLIAGCNEDETTASQGEGVVSGLVTDAATRVTLPDVTVTAVDLANETVSTTTDANGSFRVAFPTDSLGSATITLRKTGYRDTVLIV
ncbi:MAG TPA: carboxypeptidase-like regulatory domain-containing protein, partial [Bacteroidota bacterium]|nr:carboxypeptidase-like regulatory domain-containing protein [Bacteroidota bacterium]